MEHREGDERRERNAGSEAAGSRDDPGAGSAAAHDERAEEHARNAERLQRHGALREADRERRDAQREREAAEELRHRPGDE
jgi:hypothetical protein